MALSLRLVLEIRMLVALLNNKKRSIGKFALPGRKRLKRKVSPQGVRHAFFVLRGNALVVVSSPSEKLRFRSIALCIVLVSSRLVFSKISCERDGTLKIAVIVLAEARYLMNIETRGSTVPLSAA
jgi:hypothetical protein